MLSSVSQAGLTSAPKQGYALHGLHCSLPTFPRLLIVVWQHVQFWARSLGLLLPLSAFFTQVSCSSKWQGGIFQLLSGEII